MNVAAIVSHGWHRWWFIALEALGYTLGLIGVWAGLSLVWTRLPFPLGRVAGCGKRSRI